MLQPKIVTSTSLVWNKCAPRQGGGDTVIGYSFFHSQFSSNSGGHGFDSQDLKILQAIILAKMGTISNIDRKTFGVHHCAIPALRPIWRNEGSQCATLAFSTTLSSCG